ncbi:uncharacterized protein BXZ73DRAFT_88058 [Epithele typhae]|uniref:uncharacterized protein n=1 Tax=Epithele typhae TaxID=378194 RepID=UPI0020076B46|nr:uncharacterized protein BXZ73DRAFT_88058 [Epithele typhae]KAH9942509.1 hypothetical protein BXZ73DRAFT_88058 [Epithele typhae]
MGNLVWHEYARFVSIAANCYAMWAAFWGIYYRKFFWDFLHGIVRAPGGIQPAASDSIFISIIVKAPVVQLLSFVLAFVILSLERPLPFLKDSSIHRSFPIRIVLLLLQTFLGMLFYQLPASFEAARAAGDLHFFPSTVHTHAEDGIDFEIRLCPALQKKPAAPAPEFDAVEDASPAKAPQDPFAPPYTPGLFLGEVKDEFEGREYVVLFNKYSVVPHHFLIVTKEFQSQTAPLFPADLVQVYLFLVAAKKAGRTFFAFYNCGDLSGASQPHKHVQILPLDDPDGPPVEKLAREAKTDREDQPFSLPLPYANHVRRLPASLPRAAPEALEPALAAASMAVLDLAIQTVRHAPAHPRGPPSYNVLLTLEHVHCVPRARECAALALAPGGDALPVNALGFAGMLLVKGEREMDAVVARGVRSVLAESPNMPSRAGVDEASLVQNRGAKSRELACPAGVQNVEARGIGASEPEAETRDVEDLTNTSH